MKALMYTALLAVMGISSTAMAQHTARCTQDDQLVYESQARGRNAWSKKCNYISANKEAALNEEGEYQVYLEGCSSYPNVPANSTCTKYVPVDVNAACISGLSKLGSCPTGCFTPKLKMSFGGQRMPPAEALQNGVRTVTALTPQATLLAPTFGEQSIRTYVSGDTEEDIFAVKLANGTTLELTSEHPMVDGEGNIVKTKGLKTGDTLLASDGQQIPITDITVFHFKGYVWNVQPDSKEKAENIFDLEGLLTGSLRFQNQWADQAYRLSTREEADVQGL